MTADHSHHVADWARHRAGLARRKAEAALDRWRHLIDAGLSAWATSAYEQMNVFTAQAERFEERAVAARLASIPV